MAENGKSEFWKWAEQNGKIKSVSDAFEEYPVEEEWHKGNAANYDANILLTKDKQNGLEKDSIVKTDAIYQIDNSEVLFRIGTVTQSAINFYLNNYGEKPTK